MSQPAQREQEHPATPEGRVLVHRKAVRLKATRSKEVPQKFARHLQFVADELAAGRIPPDWEVLRERPLYRKVKHPPLRAMARAVDGSLLVFLIRERDDFHKKIHRVRVTFDAGDFSELGTERRRTLHVETAPLSRDAAFVPTPVDHWASFSDNELRRATQLDTILINRLRRAQRSDAAFDDDVVSAVGEPAALLLVDMAERPTRYRAILDEGRTPIPLDVEASDEELAETVAAGLASGDIIAIQEVAELERLLSGELEEWMVFLGPLQRSMVHARYNGPARLSGGPGSGKSVVALHRAIELARRAGPRERVLLTTFVTTLPKHWRALLRRIDPVAACRVEVVSVDALVRRYLPNDVGKLDIAPRARREAWARRVISADMRLIGAFGNDPDALIDEFDQVLSAAVVPGLRGDAPRPLASGADYWSLEPRFRRARTVDEADAVWACYQHYIRAIGREGLTDFGLRRLAALAQATPKYVGVVVDEAQDLSSVAIRFLWQLDASVDHSGFLVIADGQQAVYPGGYSLRALGIETRGRAQRLRTNWRTTERIQAAADAVIADVEIDDRDGSAQRRAADPGDVPLRIGLRPEVHACPDRTAEVALIAEVVADRITAGRRPRDVAVLVSTNRQVHEVVRALERAPLPIPAVALKDLDPTDSDRVVVGTFHRAKGLEFVEVVVAGLGAQTWPPAAAREGAPDAADHDRHRRALFVAMTRARDHLVITGVAPLANEMAALSPTHADLVMHL